MLAHEAYHGGVAGAGVQYAVERQPRHDVNPEAAAPAALRRVAALRPGFVVHLLRGTHS